MKNKIVCLVCFLILIAIVVLMSTLDAPAVRAYPPPPQTIDACQIPHEGGVCRNFLPFIQSP